MDQAIIDRNPSKHWSHIFPWLRVARFIWMVPQWQALSNGSLTLCLVRGNLERMKNKERKIGWKTVFFTVWQREENIEDGKPGRNSLPGPQIFSFQTRRKRKIRWKIVFFTVWQNEENIEDEKPGRNSLLGPQISSFQAGRKKARREISSPITLIHDFLTHPTCDFCPQILITLLGDFCLSHL